MSPKFVRIAHQLLFIDMVFVIITGITKVAGVNNSVVDSIHGTVGVILILLFLLHMHIHGKMLISMFKHEKIK